MGLHQRRVGRVPVGEELRSPLLDPAVEIGFRDAVRRGQQRVIGNEEAHGRILLGHFLRASRKGSGVRRHRGGHVLLRLVEHDQVAAPPRVFQEAPVVLEQVGPDGVGPRADHDRVEPALRARVGARTRRPEVGTALRARVGARTRRQQSAPWNGGGSRRIGWAPSGAVRRRFAGEGSFVQLRHRGPGSCRIDWAPSGAVRRRLAGQRREGGFVQQLDRGAERLDTGGHFVADAHDVADAGPVEAGDGHGPH